MGLSAMADMPDMDQQMRFANIAGQMQYIAPNAWVGEQNLNGLGLNDGSNTPNTINAVTGGITSIIRSIGDLKSKKKGQPSQPMVQAQPMPQAAPANNTGKLLIYGGLLLGAGVIIYLVMKKKKKSGGI